LRTVRFAVKARPKPDKDRKRRKLKKPISVFLAKLITISSSQLAS